jgi:hypothetical protein
LSRARHYSDTLLPQGLKSVGDRVKSLGATV